MLMFVPHKGKGEESDAAFRDGICTRSVHGCPLVGLYSFNELLVNQFKIEVF